MIPFLTVILAFLFIVILVAALLRTARTDDAEPIDPACLVCERDASECERCLKLRDEE